MRSEPASPGASASSADPGSPSPVATAIPAPTASATSAIPSASPRSVPIDPHHAVTLALVARRGLGTDYCVSGSDVLTAPPFPETRAALDEEVARLGTERWSTERPTWWIGDQASVEEAYGAVEVFPDPPFLWIIVPANGSWLGQLLRVSHTPAGNTVWVPLGTERVHACAG